MKTGYRVVMLLFVVLCLRLIACSSAEQDNWRGRQEVVNGIKVLHNDQAAWEGDSTKTLKLEEDLTIGGEPGDQPGQLSAPRGVAVDQEGFIYIADSGNNRVQKFDSQGNYLLTIRGKNRPANPIQAGPFDLLFPVDVDLDQEGNIYVLDGGLNRVTVFNSQGKWANLFDVWVNKPRQLELLPDGHMVVYAVTQSRLLYQFDQQGNFLGAFYDPFIENRLGSTLFYLMAYSTGTMAVDARGNLYFSHLHPYRIVKIDLAGEVVVQFDHTLPFGTTAVSPDRNGRMADGEYGSSGHLVVLNDGRLLNFGLKKTFRSDMPGESGVTQERWIDLFNSDGKLLQTAPVEVPEDLFPRCVDAQDRIYFAGVKSNRVVRYRLHIGAARGIALN